MFSLGVMTDEVSQDFAHALDVIEEFGVRTVELHSMWDKNICDLDSHELTQVLHMVRQRGFAVCDIASLFLRCPMMIWTPTTSTSRYSGAFHPNCAALRLPACALLLVLARGRS